MEQFSNPDTDKNPRILTDFTDGSSFKSKVFFQDGSKIILLLFQDSFEIVNPLGSARTKHKILATYMTLDNLYAYNRDKVDQIHLVSLCKDKCLKHFGAAKVFKRLLDDLCVLEKEGIDTGHGRHVKGGGGGVAFISGNNFGSHTIGGYLQVSLVNMCADIA
ncbi:hypothetical protein HOLleu_26012 [Holothuria leucospilota]|uniref:Uncharacterized protein n=1 Tax=Holothuria leucospilota TaxID=206669 RepID=A0A9Q1BSQ6_HOLLE|nr:hypothetical protein HOLleu_26012 [Holothuria leucospilota]